MQAGSVRQSLERPGAGVRGESNDPSANAAEGEKKEQEDAWSKPSRPETSVSGILEMPISAQKGTKLSIIYQFSESILKSSCS